MRASTSSRPGKEGNVILIVLVLLLVVTAISTVSLRNAMHMARMSQRQVLIEQAHFIAESGLEEAAKRINSTEYLGAGVTEMTVSLGGGRTARVTITPADNQGHAFSVDSVTTHQGVERRLRINRIYRPTYLEHLMFFEDFRNLWWIYGRVIDGKVWTGTHQNIYGYTLPNGERFGPIFRDVNTTAANFFGGTPEYAAYLPPTIPWGEHRYDDLRFWDEYPEHAQTNVPKPPLFEVDFDRTTTIANALNVDFREISPNHGVAPDTMPTGKALVLKGRTEIRFTVQDIGGRETGVMEIRNRNLFGDFNWNPVYSEAVDLVVIEDTNSGPGGHRNATLTLGDSIHHTPNILKGSMSIYVDRDVTIPTDIIYDNQNFEESTDKLGVISKRNIWVDRKFTGDLILQGGFIATGINGGGNMGLLDYDKHGVRGTLYFTGSQVAVRVQPWGVFSGPNFISGFHTNYGADPRFSTDPPPFTPTISSEIRYEGWH
jgi:hypothetical protein